MSTWEMKRGEEHGTKERAGRDGEGRGGHRCGGHAGLLPPKTHSSH